MAEIRPFRGLRYSVSAVKQMEAVTTPPYDVISPDAQVMYHARSKYNIIRLELGLDLDGDSPTHNRYTRARDLLFKWLRDGVLVAERKPSMYMYQHEFEYRGSHRTRRGIIACLRLEELDAGVVLPHEDTLPKPLADRLNLMRACNANFSPVFGLFEDKGDRVNAVMESVASSPPVTRMTWDDDSVHILWVIDDPWMLMRITDSLAASRVYIADGHHRYQTALRYRDEMRAANPKYSGEEAYNYVMTLLVEIDDPGLVILPTHRVVIRRPPRDSDSIEQRLNESFYVRHIPTNGDPIASVRTLLREMEEAKAANVIGAFGLRKGQFSLLLSKDDGAMRLAMPEINSPAWRSLDVSVLKVAVLDRVLGVNEENSAHVGAVQYVSDEVAAVRAVVEGRASMAWFLRPPTVQQVRDVALASDRMPHKSTYFHPKPLTGLVLNHLVGDLPRAL